MPKPQHHVFVCVQNRPQGHPRGSCGGERGSQAILDAFYREVESRMLFGRIAVTGTGCLGTCATGPSVLVYPEGIMYGGVRPEDVKSIIEEHLLGGTPVQRLRVPEEVWG